MLEQLCVYKQMSLDPKSTTFNDAKKDPNHILLNCYPCKGYDNNCKYYSYLPKEDKKRQYNGN